MKTIEIIKALLQLVAQAQFTSDVEGARKITVITQAAAAHVEELEEAAVTNIVADAEEATNE